MSNQSPDVNTSEGLATYITTIIERWRAQNPSKNRDVVIAERCDVSPTTVHRWKTKGMIDRVNMLRKLHEAIGVDYNEYLELHSGHKISETISHYNAKITPSNHEIVEVVTATLFRHVIDSGADPTPEEFGKAVSKVVEFFSVYNEIPTTEKVAHLYKTLM